MARKNKWVSHLNVTVEIEKATHYEGSLVTVQGKHAIDVFLHYNTDGTLRSTSIWNGHDWVDVRVERSV